MLEESQEVQILQDRQKQSKLFRLEESYSQQAFRIINRRNEDSIIEKFEENTKEQELDNRIELQNINTSISKNQSFINNTMKISEKEEINLVNSNESSGNDHNYENNKYSKQLLQEESINNSLSLPDRGKDESSNLKENVSSQEPHFQLVMKIKKQINLYLQKFTSIGRAINLRSKAARSMMNDLSDFYEDNSDYSLSAIKTQLCMSIQRYLNKFKLNNLKVVSMQDNYILFFKMITTILTYIYLFFLSIILIFNLRYKDEQSQSLVQNYITVQWIVEIILKLNCATSLDADYIESRSEIFSIYIKKYFFFDIIPIIAIHLNISDSFSWQYYTVKIFVFLKFYTTESDLKEIQKQLVIISRKHYIIQIINLNLNLFFVGHIIACLWQIVGIIDSNYLDNVNSWIVTTQEFSAGEWWKVYIQAFYWSFTLMATGSNIAASVLEMYFTSIVMPFTTIIFGYMINTIGIILSEIDQQEEFRRKDVNIINRYMDRKNISKDLQARVNLDLEYFYQKNFKKIQEDEEGVLSKISEQLYKSLQYEYNMGIFKKMKNLYNNFSLDTLTELCYASQEITFSPNQTIFNENQTSDSCLMYIIKGKGTIIDIQSQLDLLILFYQFKQPNRSYKKQRQTKKIQRSRKRLKVLQEQFFYFIFNIIFRDFDLSLDQDKDQYTSRVLGVLNEGQTFGELNFFTGLGRAATIKSSSFTRILKIPRDQFMEIIKDNNKDLERYCEIRDKISLYSNYSDLGFCCSICQKNDHLNNNCPITHFNKKSPFIFARINYSNSQAGDKTYQRKRGYYRQFFSKLVNVIAQAKEAQVQLITEEDEEELNQEYYDEEESCYSENQQSQRSLPHSQKLQSIAEKSLILEKQEAQLTELDKSKSSFLQVTNEANKQEEYFKRNSYFQKEDTPSQSQPKADTLFEPKKRNTKKSFILQDDYNRRISHMSNRDKEDSQQQNQNGGDVKSVQDQSRKKSLHYQQIQSLLQPDERRNTYHFNTIPSNFSAQKNKVDSSYHNYNKSDEIIKDILLWNFDKMKHFNYYFANGNFKFIINKYQMARKRQQSTKTVKDKATNIVRLSKKQQSKKTIF